MQIVLILLLKIIAHEPDIVILAVGRQRRPGWYSRLLSQPSSPQILGDRGAALSEVSSVLSDYGNGFWNC